MEGDWGRPVGVELWAPSLAADERFRHWWANHLRLAVSPGAAPEKISEALVLRGCGGPMQALRWRADNVTDA